MSKNRLLAAFVTMIIVLFTSCVKEQGSDCSQGVRLHFRYVLEGDVNGLSAFKDIRLYAFDSDGLLVKIISIDPTTLENGNKEVDIEPGRYTFVVWGSNNPDIFEGGYKEITPSVIGETTLEVFRMMLQTKTSGVGLIPDLDDFNNLYYAGAENVLIRETNQVQEVDFDFINDCKTLEIRIDGINYLSFLRAPAPDQPLKAYVLGANDRYNFQNLIDANAPTVRYEPPYKTLTSNTMLVDIKTMKLDIEHSRNNPVLLYLQTNGGADIIPPLNVVEAIMQIKDSNNNLVYTSQQDIDKKERFQFTFSINIDLSVSIAINGFVIENVSPELD